MDILELCSDLVRGTRFKFVKHLSRGKSGIVFQAVDTKIHRDLAIKSFARSNDECLRDREALKKLADCPGFPRVRSEDATSKITETALLAMDLLGEDLNSLLMQCGGKFSLKTTLMIADQLLQRLESLSDKGIIHNDLKPANILLGRGRCKDTIYIVDFAFSTKFLDRFNKHIKDAASPIIGGTIDYVSLRGHDLVRRSRRDDLESLGYVLVDLCTGSLPWSHEPSSNETFFIILKMHFDSATLPPTCPREFIDLIMYARELDFEERPDYKLWRRVFKTLAESLGLKYDNEFDWCALEQRK